MAKVTAKPKKARPRCRFTLPNGQRVETTVRTQAEKNTVDLHVNRLISSQKTGSPAIDSHEWACKLPKGIMRDNLVRWGLLEESEIGKTLADLKERFLAKKKKKLTIKAYTTAFNSLGEFFSLDRLLTTIKQKDAEDFIEYLKTEGNSKTDGPLASQSWTREARRASQFFKEAVEEKWIIENPFAKIEIPRSDVNPERQVYISREDTLRVIAMNGGNPRLQLEIALMRFAGYRGASEFRRLTWSESIQWNSKEILTHCTKTEGHVGHEIRYVPMAPIVEKILKILWAQTNPKEDRIYPNMTETSNPGVVVKKAFTRAGVEIGPPKNLRNSYDSDLMEAGFATDAKIFQEFTGHSVKMAMAHYQMAHKARREKAAEKLRDVFGTIPEDLTDMGEKDPRPQFRPQCPPSFAPCNRPQPDAGNGTETGLSLENKAFCEKK